MNTKVIGKDLTKESPRSPRIRVGGYAILGRTLDKCRALVRGNIGEYHFDCPLDNTLFGFKGVKGADFKSPNRKWRERSKKWWIGSIATAKRKRRTKSNVGRHSDRRQPVQQSRKAAMFVDQLKSLGLDPAKTTLFDWLETDDKASHQQKRRSPRWIEQSLARCQILAASALINIARGAVDPPVTF